MAELLFRGCTFPDADVTVASAGTSALVGRAIDGPSATALAELGIDPSAHRARQFEPWMAASAGLILTASRAHRDDIITHVPNAFRRVFTMKEFARYVSALAPGDPNSVVAAAAAQRGHAGPVPIDEDDVGDPFRGTLEYAKEIAEEITETVYAAVYALGFAADSWQAAQAAREYRPRHTRPLPH